MPRWMGVGVVVVGTLAGGAAVRGHGDPAPIDVAAIGAPERVDWRIAQVDVARAGAEALPDLEAMAAGAAEPLRGRIRETVELMLLKTVDLERLEAFPNLHALAAADVTRARAATAPLLEATSYDDGGPRLAPAGAPPSADRRAVAAALAIGGFAVPAAVDLCRGRTAASRLYGLELLRKLDATAQRELVESLADDATSIDVQAGCLMHRTTVGAIAAHVRFASWPFLTCGRDKPRPPLLAEAREYVLWLDRGTEADLYERLVDAGVREATSWDDYWRRARPALIGRLAEGRASARAE